MGIERLAHKSKYWQTTIDFAEICSFGVGKHLANMMKNNQFSDWESVFAAISGEKILGFCTLLKEDYFPENRYSPWISTLFVDENARGSRISEKLIEAAAQYAKENGFAKVYIPSDMTGFYEKFGFEPIDVLENYEGQFDTVFRREL